jgi:integrase/recombinase XerD
MREVKEEHMNAFETYVKTEYKKADGKPLGRRRKITLIYLIARFFKFLEAEEYIFINPARKLEFEKQGRSLPKDILSEEETERLMSAPDVKRLLGIRDRAILEVLYGSALRNEEVRSLKFHDLDLDNCFLFVKGKGSKDRVVPLTKIARKFLKLYLERVRPLLCKTAGNDTVFLNQPGKTLKGDDINNIIRESARKAGILKKVTAHTLRHTCATHLIARGANVRYVQELLGHESVETTQIYTHVRPIDLKKVYFETHPRSLQIQGKKPVESGED